jgi:radical SAM protein with 4Fe4S-binding SPASM domain
LRDHFTLELTHKCNNKCYYCYNGYKDLSNAKYIDINLAKKYIFEIIESQIVKNDTKKIIVLSGGECTLNNDYLIELLLYINKLKINKYLYKIKIDINTNCTNMSDKLINIIQQTKTCLFISGISCYKDLYNEITQTDHYDLFIENLKKVIKAKIPACMNIVTNLKNIDTLEESVDFFFNLGLQDIVTSIAHGKIEGLFDKITFQKYIDQCFSLKKKHKNKFGFAIPINECSLDDACIKPEVYNGRCLSSCAQTSNLLAITPDNKIITCGRQPHNMFVKADTLDEGIIKMNKACQLLPNRPFECIQCPYDIVCFGRCGHEVQFVDNEYMMNKIKIAYENMYDEASMKDKCMYYKHNGHFPEEVEYVHENLYYIWDILNYFRKVYNDEEYF